MKNFNNFTSSFILFICILASNSVFANTYTYIGGENANWDVTSNWLPNYPGKKIAEGDQIIIPEGSVVVIDSEAFLENKGMLINRGTLLNYGRISNIGTIINNGDIKSQAGGSVINSGLFANRSGALLQTTGIFINNGTLHNEVAATVQSNNSIINDFRQDEGIVSPGVYGQDIALMDITGDFNAAAKTANLLIEIAGTQGPGEGHDQLNIGGTATLDGHLSVSLLDGFLPELGDEFVIMTQGTRTGEFSTSTLPNISPNAWDIAYTDTKVILRVVPAPHADLLYFDAWLEGEEVMLEWLTSSEYDNKGFEIERSADQTTWANIGFVESQGDSDSPTQYNTIDRHPMLGANYYRLKQINKDGSFRYSEVRRVDLTREMTFGIFPNPVATQLNISIDGTFEPYTVTIYSRIGQLMRTVRIENETAAQFDVSDLADGMYILSIEAGDRIITEKFIKH